MAEKQYIAFKLGEVEFGVEIGYVTEIILYTPSTTIPNTPEYVEGVINYRGKVIPIVKLSQRLKVKGKEITSETRIIIVEVSGKTLGLIVDDSSKIVRLMLEDIDENVDETLKLDSKIVKGVGKHTNGQIMVIIELENILG